MGRTHCYKVILAKPNHKSGRWLRSTIASHYKWCPDIYFNKKYIKFYDTSYFYKLGMEEIKDDYWRALKYSLQHITHLTYISTPFPTTGLSKELRKFVNYFNTFIVLFIGIPGILTPFFFYSELKKSKGIILIFGVFAVVLMAMIFFGTPRFRIPFDIFLIMLASLFYVNFYKEFQQFLDETKRENNTDKISAKLFIKSLLETKPKEKDKKATSNHSTTAWKASNIREEKFNEK